MGFLDNVLKKLGAALATSYGVVSSGEYNGCRIALGNPPKKKVSTAYNFSQMIFIKDDKENYIYLILPVNFNAGA